MRFPNKGAYKAIRVKQNPKAAPFYLISVKASELLKWSDVPRKKADYMAGYQRELGDRHEKIKEFLEKSPQNILPGAIIVSVDKDACEIKEFDGYYDINIKTKDYSLEDAIEVMADRFYERLSDDEKESINNIAIEEQEIVEEESNGTDEDVQPDSYMAQLTKELMSAKKDICKLKKERREAVEEYVLGVSKPGRILDGQHRVFGAKNVSAYDVELPVVLLPELDYAEQVFHFYVLNNKAKPLSPTELRSVVSTSLTNIEIENLWGRFKQAGVYADEASWTFKISTDEDSPFRGLIDFGLGGEGFIKENVAHQLVKAFMSHVRRVKTLTDGVKSWENDPSSEYRLKIFYSFWQGVKENYLDLWNLGVKDGGGQIFLKVSMLVLQELLLDYMTFDMPKKKVKGEPSPFSDLEELKVEVKTSLTFLPELFFEKEWKEKQLDTSKGKTFLKNQMDTVIKKGGKNIGNMKLFRG